MDRQGRNTELLGLSAILGLAALGCVLLYGLRVAISGKIWYLYLVWNLALACVPYLIAVAGSLFMPAAAPARTKAWRAAPFAVAWLVFYPNSPYILTDFIHVINRTYLRSGKGIGDDTWLWYDLIMNAAFAFMGHFIGLVSMWFVQGFLRRAWGPVAARVLVLLAILVSGFGIYLGRFLRLNSWDLLLSPQRVLPRMSEAAGDPKAILFSAAFALFIFLTYASLIMFKRLRLPENPS
jgi:uncharacterized membrane protein